MLIRTDILTRRRRGSLALEAIMVLPVVIILVLLASFILEGMLARHETAVHSRNTAARVAMVAPASLGTVTLGTACLANPNEAGPRDNVSRSIYATCKWRDAEAGMKKRQPFFDMLDRSARGAPYLHTYLSQLDTWDEVKDLEVTGRGGMSFDKPAFLTNQGATSHRQIQLRGRSDIWTYGGISDAEWQWGHDRAIWEKLEGGRSYYFIRTPLFFPNIPVVVSGHAQDLFPNVFPSRNEK